MVLTNASLCPRRIRDIWLGMTNYCIGHSSDCNMTASDCVLRLHTTASYAVRRGNTRSYSSWCRRILSDVGHMGGSRRGWDVGWLFASMISGNGLRCRFLWVHIHYSSVVWLLITLPWNVSSQNDDDVNSLLMMVMIVIITLLITIIMNANTYNDCV